MPLHSRTTSSPRFQRYAASDPSQGKPAWWPFGALTEAQIRERTRLEARMRAGRLAALPEALL